MAERKATVGKHTAAEIASGITSPHDFVQVVDADQNPAGPLLFNPVGGGTPLSLDPGAAQAESTGIAETMAGIEALIAELSAQSTAKTGTIHHGALAAYAVRPEDADYELHLEEAIDPGPPSAVVAPGAVHFNGNVLTSDAFVLRVVNTTEIAGAVTWANFSGVFVRDAGGAVNDITAQPRYVVDGDSSLLITLTNNGGALFLNLFPAASGVSAGALGGLQSALASLAAQVSTLSIPADAGMRAAIASLVARLDALAVPITSGIAASLASVRAILDVHDKDMVTGASERTGIVESIAGIEARLTVVEDDDDVVGAADAVAIASLAALVESIDIPATDPIHAALASLVARLETLVIPVDGSMASSIASLRAALDAMPVVSTDALETAVAGLQSAFDALDIPVTAPAEAAIASTRTVTDGHDRDIATGSSERIAITESLAGVEANLAAQGDNGITVLGADATLAGTAGTFGGVGISAVLPSAGRWRVTASIHGVVTASVVGTDHWIVARLFDATAVAAVANTETMVALNANTTKMAAAATITAIIDTAAPRQIDLQAARGAATGTNTVASGANGRTSIQYERLR